MTEIQINEEWKSVLEEEFQKPYFQELTGFLREQTKDRTIYPPGPLIFKAFENTPFSKVKVVVLGQDPYHGPGQAMGLSFSVPRDCRIPPSLRNVFKELKRDLNIEPPDHGDLSYWSRQGVFLLNAILTVEKNKAASHRKKGWEQFTDAVIKKISAQKKGVVFLLWGNFAKSKRKLIDETRHHVLEAAHPSPLARTGFIDCNHFSKANELLLQEGYSPIDWDLKKDEK
jgi:uracil-DNA glycosylase